MTAEISTADRPAEFDARVVAHLPMLKRLAARYCHANEREEVVQETVAWALANWSGFRTDGSFYRWLHYQLMHVTKSRKYHDTRYRKINIEDPDGYRAATASVPARQEDLAYLGQVVDALDSVQDGDMVIRHAIGDTLEQVGATRRVGGERARQRCKVVRTRLRKRMRHKVAA